jgi:glucose/arabinose dehydrogenase
MAFAPDYADSGRFYVYYTDRVGNGNVNVVEYRRSPVNPDVADPSSARPILQVVKPYENHNAGMMQFGPDGFLYIAVGDGDSGVINPPGAFAQSLDDLLGNILRIDPLHPAAGAPYSIPGSQRRVPAARSGTTGCATLGGSGSTP